MISVSEARRHLPDLLDTVQQGNEVILEREGVRFRIIMETPCPVPGPSPVTREGRKPGEADGAVHGRGDRENLVATLLEISRRCGSLPDLDPRSADEILGYDEHGTFLRGSRSGQEEGFQAW